MSDDSRSITILVHGESKVGKSTFAVTAPYPRLLLDVEGGYKFLPIVKRMWDPKTEPTPPVADGTWDTTVVRIHDYQTFQAAMNALMSGQHQFKSVIIDSISELQEKLMRQISGNEQMQQREWGELLRSMGETLRSLRDLTDHPYNPLSAVVLVAMTKQNATTGKYHPYLQGQIATTIPYLYDITGAIVVSSKMNPDPTQPPIKYREMLVESTPQWEAGERVQGRLGSSLVQGDLNISTILDKIYGPVVTAPAAEAN